MPLWRNRLARSAVNRKVGGSNPPRGDYFFVKYVHRLIRPGYERLSAKHTNHLNIFQPSTYDRQVRVTNAAVFRVD